MKKRFSKGFTLIELLVVIAIIGILASIVLASLNTARQKSRDARRIADLNQIRTALELYFNDKATYPVDTTKLSSGNYIPAIPLDPLGAAYSYAAVESNNTTPCGADESPACTSFVIGATIEGSEPATANDIDGTVYSVDCADPVYCLKP